ncbi:MAG TPA: ELWxxDGT repeat protein [Thermoanaerobaculia bacterium]|nr:ELWxxDGT repeat protein [Thermoanaerobaculia bacterium]
MRTARRLAAISLAFATHAAAASAQPAHLVADLVAEPSSSYGSYVHLVTAAGGHALFDVESRDGRELWGSNGTAAGTELLFDACPGACTPVIAPLGVAQGIAFWRVELSGSGSGAVLMRSDGTRAGTYRLSGPDGDLHPNSSYYEPVVAHGRLFFRGYTAGSGDELWQSDGSEAGTLQIADLLPGPDGSYPTNLAVAGSTLFFAATDAEGTRTLYAMASDGGAPTRVVDLASSIFTTAVTATRLFYVTATAGTSELWTSDGTAAGTRRLSSFPASSASGSQPWLEPAGDHVLFRADDGIHHPQIWRSDGTPAGTVRLTDLPPPPGSYEIVSWDVEEVGGRLLVIARDANFEQRLVAVSGPGQPPVILLASCPECFYSSGLERVGERVLFQRYEPGAGTHLWTTDGTAAGTQRLARVCPQSCFSYQLRPVFAGRLFFATDEAGHTALRETDGTVAGTRILAPLPDGVAPATEALAIGDRVFFTATAPQGHGLWVSDTAKGETHAVASVVSQRPSSRPRELVAIGDRLFFAAPHTGQPQPQLWTSQGSAETPAPLTQLLPNSSSPPGPSHLTVVGQQVFFWIDSFEFHGRQPLWRSDGTAAGTFPLLADQRIDEQPAVFDGELFYLLDEPGSNTVWKSDGTVAGTQPAFELPAGVRDPRHLTAVGDELYFLALSVDGTEVWRSDGTTAGVQRVTAFAGDGPFYETDPSFMRTRGGVVFRARADSFDQELWSTGGTPQSTHRLAAALQLTQPRPLAVVAGSLYFFATGPGGRALWRTDGTDAGTVLLRSLTDTYSPRRRESVALDGQLFFVADDGTHGLEPWATDGTAAGTRLVADLAPGEASSSPSWLTATGSGLFFAAHDGIHGFELWKSDGTAAGTRLVHDVAPGAASSYPEELALVGSRLYFSADDGVVGQELWALDLGAPSGQCVPSPTALCLGGHFRVEATWFVGNQMGTAHAIPLTADTGGFWFFGAENVEVVLKVLDGRPVNQHQWVFYGALSDVEYHLTVTDTETGLARRYVNPAGLLASVADTNGFGRLGAFAVAPRPRAGTPPRRRASVDPAAAKAGLCVPAPTRLCLRDGRFAVEATWKDFAGHSGVGTAVPLTGDTGWFWFFGPTNVEVILKVLDGTPVNGKHWVFYGALSNVEYTLRVTDTTTGAVRTYTNPSGNLASVADTAAF